MLCRIYETGNEGEQDGRKTHGRPQATFLTPLQDLPRFIALIAPFFGELNSARFRIDLVVFDPTNLAQVAPEVELNQGTFHGETIEVVGTENCLKVLELALSDWVDFLFTPDPTTMQIYADHDEFITLYPESEEELQSIVQTLSNAGYRQVKYRRAD